MRIIALLILTGMYLPASLHAQDLGDPSCDKLLLVSGFFSNNVKIYNACDGSYIRDLDSDGYLAGPQAIAVDPDGNIVVASEGNSRLVRYHRSSLTYDTVLSGDKPETSENEVSPVQSPTGLVISEDGRMFAGAFNANTVTEVNPETGQLVNRFASVGGSAVRGPDTGMLLDGNRLIVPGFNSSSVIETNINQPDSDKVLVTAGAGNINAPRTVLKTPEGHYIITSWRGNQILEFDSITGAFRRVVAAINRPTGMAWESDDVLLIASDANNTVSRVRFSDGQNLDSQFISFTNGGLQGPTFVLVLEKQVSKLAENQAFWLVGVGTVDGKTIQLDEMFYTTGGVFGDNFNPADIGRTSWGSITITFTACDAANFSWISTDQAFGSGGYGVVRIAADPYGDLCASTGFVNINDPQWMSGLFFGGAVRDGEGFSVNILNGGLAVVTWYTYLPVSS